PPHNHHASPCVAAGAPRGSTTCLDAVGEAFQRKASPCCPAGQCCGKSCAAPASMLTPSISTLPSWPPNETYSKRISCSLPSAKRAMSTVCRVQPASTPLATRSVVATSVASTYTLSVPLPL